MTESARSAAAFLLPAATALSGMRINALLFPGLWPGWGMFGLRLALGLATGSLVLAQAGLMGAIAGLSLWTWLAGLAFAGGLVEGAGLLRAAWRERLWRAATPAHGYWLLLLPAIYPAFLLARLSVSEDLREFDAVAFWALKAKMLHGFTGEALVRWIGEPSLAYAHMEYPLLVPGLYAATFGAQGGVGDLALKVWPLWFLAALTAAAASSLDLVRRPTATGVSILLSVLFLPATLTYVRLEGATMPLAFFCVLSILASIEASRNQGDGNPWAAWVISLTAGAMTKNEGLIFAAVSAPALWWSWRGLGPAGRGAARRALGLAAVLAAPYLIYLLLSPAAHPESRWIENLRAQPTLAAARFPALLWMSLRGRLFDAPLMSWCNEELGTLGWVILALTGWLLAARPRERRTTLSIVAASLGSMIAITAACSCLERVLRDPSRLAELADLAGRYYFPFILAWYAGAAVLATTPGPSSNPPQKR